jgi:lipopolysaccharide export system ATP-binding protein
LEEFKITHIRKTISQSCSGGERRRLEIARALASEPGFLLLDEPFAGIDPIAVDDIKSIINSLRTKGMGILITDHNVRETLSITDRAYVMYKSEVLTEGTSQFLANDEEAKRIYLGESFSLG